MKTEREENLHKILEYWLAVEFLSQDNYPRGEEKPNNNYIDEFLPLKKEDLEKSLYEIIADKARENQMNTWGSLTLYLGKVAREDCIKCIQAFLPYEDDTEESPDKNTAQIACVCLRLSSDGTYRKGSLSVSPILWAIRQLHKAGKDFSGALDEKLYKKDMETMEKQFFDQDPDIMDKGEPRDGDESRDNEEPRDEDEPSDDQEFQEFSPNAVTVKDLRELLACVDSQYVDKYLPSDETGSCLKKAYGIGFQLFKDEEKRVENEDDNKYPGMARDFYSDDIKMILDKVDDGSLDDTWMGEDLGNYILSLCPGSDHADRMDLVNEPGPEERDKVLKTLLNITDVKNAPLGKWPSKYMPAFMQQVAINLSVGKTDEGSGQIFSVNGPPGTGKTTLLKEIVVNNVVERAILLSGYEKPDEAFEKHKFLGGPLGDHSYIPYVRSWYSLKDDRINDYSTLVASCNNAAVENITKELPVSMVEELSSDGSEALKEVADLFDPEVSGTQEIRHYSKTEAESYRDIYFTKYAQKLVGNKDTKIWGLIAAPLGRKPNISRFYRYVLSPLNTDFYSKNTIVEDRLNNYKEVRKQFKEQLKKVQSLQEELQVPQRCLEKKLRCREALTAAKEKADSQKTVHEQAIAEAQETICQFKESQNACQKESEDCQAQIDTLKNEIAKLNDEIKTQKDEERSCRDKEMEAGRSVGLMNKLFNRKKYDAAQDNVEFYRKCGDEADAKLTEFNQELAAKQAELDQYTDRKNASGREEKDLDEKIQQEEKTIKDHRDLLEKEGREYTEAEEQYEEACREYDEMSKSYEQDYDGGQFFDEEFFDDLYSSDEETSTKAQVSDPWFTKQYDLEREKLFALAMRLNKEFVLSTKCCRDNLKNLAQYWGLSQEKVKFKKEDIEQMLPALFQTLFLLVPVISTTFSSAGTMLKDVKKSGTIGMLVVDEAGQAQPQMALGSLYRCRKAVIVGDPKQVEPVVTDDLDLLKQAFSDDLLAPYKVKSVSVQNFADQLNRFGTYLQNDTDYPDWVGCPLLVHRRCISPMYDISNEISYNNFMKQQTPLPKKTEEERFIFETSRWINVAGAEKGNKDHYVKAQGEVVCDLLNKAFEKQERPDIYIISPFTTVVSGIKDYLENHWETDPENKKYIVKDKRIGTVHTFQGKEAEEVIFLLGCDRGQDAAGAVRWVNNNIVNVAATRAKYRLYIVGDAKTWEQSHWVSMAKDIMDTYAIKRIKEISESDLSEEERDKALKEALDDLPPASSFAEEIVDEEGTVDYSIETSKLISGLDQDFLDTNLSIDQLEEFGFHTQDEIEQFSPEVKENLLLGMKLYFLLKPLYALDPNLDASCCAILFCKALELQMQDCFYETFRDDFPEFTINGGGGRICLRIADKEDLTLGTIAYVLKNHRNEEVLADQMQLPDSDKYDAQWWRSFSNKLDDGAKKRNDCCHTGLFDWQEQSKLLQDIFKEDEVGRVNGWKIGGLLFESEIENVSQD